MSVCSRKSRAVLPGGLSAAGAARGARTDDTGLGLPKCLERMRSCEASQAPFGTQMWAGPRRDCGAGSFERPHALQSHAAR